MYPPTISKTRSANDLLMVLTRCFFIFLFFFSDILKAYVVGTHLNCIDKSNTVTAAMVESALFV